jgi:hypothetical protein
MSLLSFFARGLGMNNEETVVCIITIVTRLFLSYLLMLNPCVE